jgi:hypothetical protein
MLDEKSINAYNMFNEYLNEKSLTNEELLDVIAESSYSTISDIASVINNFMDNSDRLCERDMLDLAYLHNDIENLLEEMDYVW